MKYELLAPAGSIEAFFAAMEAGADAVYCGLKDFSARAKAKNFTLEEMERLAAYAHSQGRRLYVALNTLIKEQELPRLVEILATLGAWPVDGIIIQDLGLWRLARQHFPELPLHASTQLTIHNAVGVKMLERMGFARAVLAREMSIEEIAAIRGQTTMELEHFVHGALCYSISGHCLFSSHLTGQSGNRGRCAQPCRRRYTAQGKSGFYFSTSDLSAISLLPRLMAAGVMSFKIEGRMKSAEYVSTVVSAYRTVLDAKPANQRQAIKEAEEMLAEAFGRSTTTGLLKGSAAAGVASPATKGGIGRPLGTVARVQGNAIFLTTAEVVHVGDRLRIQPQSDLSGSAFTVQELSLGHRQVKRAEAKSGVRIATPFRGLFQPGDQVYTVATGKTFTLSPEACQRRLNAVPLRAVPVHITVSCQPDQLTVTAQGPGCGLQQGYEVEMLPATHSPLNREALQRTFAKTGHPGLTVGKFSVEALPPVVIKPSRLNEIRRDFYAGLSHVVDSALLARHTERVESVRAALLPAKPLPPVETSTLSVVAKGSRDLTILETQAVQRLILPLTPDLVDAAAKQAERLRPHHDRIVWDIPAVIFEGEWRPFQTVIRQLQQRGFSAFRLNNLGHFQLFADQTEAGLMAGPWLYVLNSQAALALGELGVRSFSLSLEDDQKNMADILAREVPASATATVYSPIALLTSRIPMRAMPSGTDIPADSGETIRLDLGSGLTVVKAGRDYSLLGQLQRLRAMGCGEFIIDLSGTGVVSPHGQAVLSAVAEDRPVADTTLFNFERGLA
jgi:putative protease